MGYCRFVSFDEFGVSIGLNIHCIFCNSYLKAY